MTVKSVFQVTLDDSQFKKFKALFDKYESAVKSLPRSWQAVNQGVKENAEAIEANNATLQEQVQLLVRQELVEHGIIQHQERQATGWQRIVSKAHEFDKTLERGTIRILKWGTAATGVLGGLSAIGLGVSLFGLDRMASAVAANRRTAMGLGAGYGEVQSANANLSRLIEPRTLLEGVSMGKYDITSPEYTSLLMAGVRPSGSTGEIAAQFLERLPQILKNTPQGLIGATSKNLGLTNIMPLQDIVAYMNAPPEERRRMVDSYRSDSKAMEVKTDAQRKWADLTTQLARATQTIESVFMTKLAAIEQPIQDLSNSFVSAVQGFANSKVLDAWLKDLNSALEGASKYISSDDFQVDVKNWVSWIARAGKSIFNLVSSLGITTPAKAEGVDYAGMMGQGADRFLPGDTISPGGMLIRNGQVIGPASQAMGGIRGFWTDDKVKHAYDRLMATGKFSEWGAAGAVARMTQEAPGGPSQTNSQGNTGTAQWGGARKSGLLKKKDPYDFDTQLDYYAGEDLDSPDQAKAKRAFGQASNAEEGSLAATYDERAEGYRESGGRQDVLTYRTPVQKVWSITHPSAAKKPTVTIRDNTPNNPVRSSAQSSNPTTATAQ